MTPILSIVIATKNRVSYCINTIETILNVAVDDFELVVQDNSDSLDLQNFIKLNISDRRLVYNYTPPPFSSIDNFNAAVDLASGEYVCMIGDDDGINPDFFKIARIAHKNGFESLGSSQIAEYYWPGAVKRYKDGNLSIPYFSGTYTSFDPKKRLIPLLMIGVVNYIPFNLPRVYHGLIKRSLLIKIKEKTGYFFGGLSPDIYSTIVLSTLVKKHILIDYPLTIAGTCSCSTSAASENGEHSGRLEDAPHLRNRHNYNWENIVPRYYSVQTIWAETAIKALREFDQESLIKHFNVNFLVAQSLKNNQHIKDLIVKETTIYLKKEKKSVIFSWLGIYIFLSISKSRNVLGKLYRSFYRKKNERINYNNVSNIKMATIVLTQYVNKKNLDPVSMFREV